jgi:hypothetical protein
VWSSRPCRTSGGDASNKRHITLDGFDVEVTENLAVALRSLRQRESARTLWIDAICINQTDNSEKDIRVAAMGAVYESAGTVIVWAGPESNSCGRCSG